MELIYLVDVKVKDLVPGTGGHCLVVQVLSVAPIVEKVHLDGSVARIAEILVGDETGTVVLTARNEQIDRAQVGKYLVLRNAEAAVYRGFMRLRVTVWGKLSLHPDGVKSTPKVPKSIADNNNMSLVEYELVPADDE
ncbi:hypothetical protein THRCLA_20111 [Thraustotheca clavata]|uniref:Single-stranded DNA binding protein Ssb-like OB fold domain-containing protein n=1 Tax=Thraustotheca clavata TaxID=74557 RepID=A0A1W0ABE5_9STRA|nr:hypothetical protein THRCLA_20111 [Thraustotheca clavata]